MRHELIEMRELNISLGKITLAGNLTVPEDARSIVIFSHGSGSSRFSPRNNFVADVLNKEKIATLLIDLLTPEEDRVFENRFNIPLLTERLVAVTGFIRKQSSTANLSIGYFGASTGAASALMAAAQIGPIIRAVVSRGGRPDLARESLAFVKAPTLLIIGSLDAQVIDLNEEAYTLLNCEKKIEIVTGASHLFEEPGKLTEVANLARDWFKEYIHKPEIKEHVV